MKRLIAVSILVLFALPVHADTLLYFQDGSVNVWRNIYEKGAEFCTQKPIGEVCFLKADSQVCTERSRWRRFPGMPVPGIYSGMPIQFYHGEKMKHILSKSTLVKYRACPAGAKHDKRLM